MRILYLHQYYCPPGGHGNNRSRDLTHRWQAAGHDITVLTSPAYFPDSLQPSGSHSEFEDEGVRVIALNVDYAHEMPFRQRVRAWIKFFFRAQRHSFRLSNDYDLIYASSTPLTIGELGRRLARRWQIPFVFETVDVWPDVPIGMGIVRNRFLGNLIQGLTDRIYRQSAAIVALSEGMRDQVLSHAVPPDKVHVVHNGTDPQAFAWVERPARHGCRAIYTGTIGQANGVDFLVDVAEKLKAKGRDDIQILVVGQGNDAERVKAYWQEKQLENIEFKDRVPKEEVPDLLANADVGLVTFAPFPVLEANSANKFYDYLATGLPVVLNYEGWQKEYLDEWKCGIAVPQGDVEGYVSALERLADAPEERIEMGKRGRELIEEKFDRGELAEQLLNLFQWVVLQQ